MQNQIDKFILSVLLTSLFGCQYAEDWWQEQQDIGTNIGFEKCLDKNKSIIVKESTIRYLCLKRHVKGIPTAKLQGLAGYKCMYGICTFEGSIENKSDDYIITEVIISITHPDNIDSDKKQKSEILIAENLWIEPREMGAIHLEKLNFIPKSDRLAENGKNIYSWDIFLSEALKVHLK